MSAKEELCYIISTPIFQINFGGKSVQGKRANTVLEP